MRHSTPPGLTWRRVSGGCAITGDALHLWRIELEHGDADRDALALASLSARQRARHARLRSDLHRRRYLRAQGGCRAILASYVGAAPEELAFRYGAAGKPELDVADHGLAFNLTTTGDLALLAVSAADLPVGVDCEQVRPRRDALAIARRMFSPEVADALAELPPAAQLEAFHVHWTALESRVKADGRGLARHREPDLPGLEVAHAALTSAIGDSYICAVARQRLPSPPAWQAVQLDIG